MRACCSENRVDLGSRSKNDTRGGPTTHSAKRGGTPTPPEKAHQRESWAKLEMELAMASTQIANNTGRNPAYR